MEIQADLAKRYRQLKAVPMTKVLAARRSHIHGWGLFVLTDIEKGGMIVEYMGELIRKCVADQREKQYEELGIGSCYLFAMPGGGHEANIVDATRTGHVARFINHCCVPNAYAQAIEVGEGVQKLIIFAARALKAGEEVTYDYQFEFEASKLSCHCGAVGCKGYLN